MQGAFAEAYINLSKYSGKAMSAGGNLRDRLKELSTNVNLNLFDHS